LDAPSNQVNWSGFYLIDTSRKERDELILGPFHGKVACQTIALGRGVCGTAAAGKKTVRVADVEAFPGHIACDSESKSEIVVPIVTGDAKLVGIIDIDCSVLNGFDEVDQAYLEKLATLLASSCDWP
jgi:L-methionine (R)-S-oxide reductase